MKITATSTFHEMLSETFIGCELGVNVRRLHGPRTRYCLDYAHGSQSCGCGYPLNHTRWDAPAGFEVLRKYECDRDGQPGRGYIAVEIIPAGANHY